MNTGIEVNVFYLKNENDIIQQEAGVSVDFSDCILKKYKLYHIDYVTPYDKNKCVVSSAGLDFIIAETYESVNRRIEERQTYRLN
jgi:hypothetical protein